MNAFHLYRGQYYLVPHELIDKFEEWIDSTDYENGLQPFGITRMDPTMIEFGQWRFKR